MFMAKKKKLTFVSLLTGAVLCFGSFSIVSECTQSLEFLYGVQTESDDYNNAISYVDMLVEEIGKVPIEDDFIPQGLTVVDEYYLASYYNYDKSDNSCIYVLDKDGNTLNICDIGNKAHVGGIAYDSERSLIWVTGSSGCINAYHKEDILENSIAIPCYSNLYVGNNLRDYINPLASSASFLTIYGNELFVGNFSLSKQGVIKRYGIYVDSDSDELALELVGMFEIPDKVQGVAFYKFDNKEYIIFSRSFGAGTPSVLQIFEYNSDFSKYDDKLNYVAIEVPSMIEQITIDNNYLYAIYESAAKPYVQKCSDAKNNIDKIYVDEAIKKLVIEKDTSINY